MAPSHQLNPDTGISIQWQELYPIYLACMLWAPLWANRRICFHCDNQATVAILSAKSSKISRIMNLVCLITLQTLKFNFTFSAEHVPCLDNSIADSLSRFQMARFHLLASSLPDPSFPDQSLTLQAASFIYHSVAVTTRRTYSSGECQFIHFCLHHGLVSPNTPLLPSSETTLIHFATHLSNTVSYGTISGSSKKLAY